MKKETITRIDLVAPEGMIYTNGTTYGEKIHLAEGLTGEDYYLITKEEYKEILARKNPEMPI